MFEKNNQENNSGQEPLHPQNENTSISHGSPNTQTDVNNEGIQIVDESEKRTFQSIKGTKEYNCSYDLNVEYFYDSNDYILYCSQSKSIFNLQKLNKNFEIEDKNNIYDLTEKFVECNNSYLNLLIDNSDRIKLLTNCDDIIQNFQVEKIINSSSSSFIIKLISSSSNFTNHTFSLQTNKSTPFIIIQQNTSKTKEEIKKNIKNIIKNFDLNKLYEIFGQNFKLKISLINNKNYISIPTYVDFLSCKDKLRDYYHIPDNENFFVFLIEINKDNNKSLINQVEYIVFDEKKKYIRFICLLR